MADDHDGPTEDERRLAALLIERFGPQARRRRDRPNEPAPGDEPPRPAEHEREEDP